MALSVCMLVFNYAIQNNILNNRDNLSHSNDFMFSKLEHKFLMLLIYNY